MHQVQERTVQVRLEEQRRQLATSICDPVDVVVGYQNLVTGGPPLVEEGEDSGLGLQRFVGLDLEQSRGRFSD